MNKHLYIAGLGMWHIIFAPSDLQEWSSHSFPTLCRGHVLGRISHKNADQLADEFPNMRQCVSCHECYRKELDYNALDGSLLNYDLR